MFLILLTLLLGSMLVTGLSFLVASLARDTMSVIAWSTLLLIVLSLPAFIIMIPGLESGIITFIPSYFLVEILHRTLNYDIGWAGNANNILYLIGANIFFVLLGIVTLSRKVHES